MTGAIILAVLFAIQAPAEEPRIDPFTVHIFTAPRGSAATQERMHAAVDDAIAITELSAIATPRR